jgi:hypothetical protein
VSKKNLGEAKGVSQIGCVLRSWRTTLPCRFGDDYFLPTVFFLAGFLAAAFFTGAFLAADFFLAGIRFPPFPLATAKIGENHVNNSLLGVNSSLRKRRQRIFFEFLLIFFEACAGSLGGNCSRSKI